MNTLPETCAESVTAGEAEETGCVRYKYDKDLADSMKPTLEYILVAMMLLSVPLIIASLKWRNWANLIIYYEGVRLVVEAMVPMNGWNMGSSI